MKEKGSIIIPTLIAVVVIVIGVTYYLTTISKSSRSQEPGPILNDALLPPGSVRNVQLVINFGQGKRYETLQDVIKNDEKTPLGLLKGNRFGIKRELNFDKYYADELIVIDSNNNLQAIGDYKSDSSHKWTSYVNSKAVINPFSYILKDKDQIEWIYELK